MTKVVIETDYDERLRWWILPDQTQRVIKFLEDNFGPAPRESVGASVVALFEEQKKRDSR
jgi:hypothetical protein